MGFVLYISTVNGQNNISYRRKKKSDLEITEQNLAKSKQTVHTCAKSSNERRTIQINVVDVCYLFSPVGFRMPQRIGLKRRSKNGSNNFRKFRNKRALT